MANGGPCAPYTLRSPPVQHQLTYRIFMLKFSQEEQLIYTLVNLVFGVQPPTNLSQLHPTAPWANVRVNKQLNGGSLCKANARADRALRGSQEGGGQLQQSHVKIHTVIMWQTKTIDKRPKARSAGGRSGGGGMAGYGTSLNRRRGAFPPVSQPASQSRLLHYPVGQAKTAYFSHMFANNKKSKASERKAQKASQKFKQQFFVCAQSVCVMCVLCVCLGVCCVCL